MSTGISNNSVLPIVMDKESKDFDIMEFSKEHQDWYDHCMTVLQHHYLTLNASEDGNASVSFASHFGQPTDSICEELVDFTTNPVSVFGDSTRTVMIAVYS